MPQLGQTDWRMGQFGAIRSRLETLKNRAWIARGEKALELSGPYLKTIRNREKQAFNGVVSKNTNELKTCMSRIVSDRCVYACLAKGHTPARALSFGPDLHCHVARPRRNRYGAEKKAS